MGVGWDRVLLQARASPAVSATPTLRATPTLLVDRRAPLPRCSLTGARHSHAAR
jgi:hypothetical protein